MAKYSEKYCCKCSSIKPPEEFYIRRYKTKTGMRETLSQSCKECTREMMRKHSAKPEIADKKKAVSSKWRKDNPGAFTKYWRKNKDKLIPYALARRKRARAPEEYRKEVQAIYQKARKLSKKLGKELHVDHIIPVCMGGKTVPENLQIITAEENLRKGRRAYSVLGGYTYR